MAPQPVQLVLRLLLATNMNKIPKTLQNRKQWILWKLLPDKSGRMTKVPFQRNGQKAASTRPEEWDTFVNASYAIDLDDEEKFSGLAYVFNKDVIGIDLDYAFFTVGEHKGEIKPWARAIVDRFNSYTEYSPTRIDGVPKGVHILLNGTAEFSRHKKYIPPTEEGHEDAVEVYTAGRFFTVTGDVFEDRETIADVSEKDFLIWHSNIFFVEGKKIEPAILSPITTTTLPSDEKILDKIRNSRNGTKFRVLYDKVEGWKELGFQSQSEADLSLSGSLMFFACNDQATVDRLFRRSTLYRAKWDEKHGQMTYGAMTITKAFRDKVMNWLDPLADDPQDILQSVRLFGEIQAEKTDLGYVLTSPGQTGKIVFSFTEIIQSKQEIDALVKIQIHPVDDDPSTPYILRMDIKSQSQQSSLVTNLNKAYGDLKKGGYNWSLIINAACAALMERMHSDTGIILLSKEIFKEPEFLMYPFLQKNSVNMFFASSETGKSWTALHAAICIASGTPMLGYPAPTGLRTLYIDYEDTAQILASRLHRLCAGAGLSYEQTSEYIDYLNLMGSVRDNVEVLRKHIADGRYSLIVIDAGGDAAGGSPNDEQKVIELFNSLQTLNCTKLIIHHEPKDTSGRDDTSAFYGSMYWRGRSRVAWRLVKTGETEEGATIKMSLAKKSNLGSVDAIYYQLKHERKEDIQSGAIPKTTLSRTMKPMTIDQMPDKREVVLKAIGDEGASMNEIAENSWLTKKQVRTVVERLEGEGAIYLDKVHTSTGKAGWKWRIKKDE